MKMHEMIKTRAAASNTTVVVYEPGNMTKYVVSFTRVGKDTRPYLGGTYAVSILNMGKSAVFGDMTAVRWDYVGEKLGLSEGDARPITDLLHELAGE